MLGRKTKNRIFSVANGLVMAIMMFIFILPFWLIISASLSDNSILRAEGLSPIIKGFNFDGYKFLFSMSDIFLRSLFNSLLVSTVTAVASVIVCTAAAYALSRKYLVGRKFFNYFLMITMFFSGGTIPTYLIIRGVGIYNTIWALILPGVASTYNILLMRNYFYSMPDGLEEAARIDGAGDLRVLIKIFLPLSLPMMFTIGLMTFVGKWNNWTDSLLYLGATNQNLWTAQYVLKQMLADMQTLFGSSSTGSVSSAPLITAKNAGIVVVVLPLVVLSPVLQKFFVSGLTAGAMKG